MTTTWFQRTSFDHTCASPVGNIFARDLKPDAGASRTIFTLNVPAESARFGTWTTDELGITDSAEWNGVYETQIDVDSIGGNSTWTVFQVRVQSNCVVATEGSIGSGVGTGLQSVSGSLSLGGGPAIVGTQKLQTKVRVQNTHMMNSEATQLACETSDTFTTGPMTLATGPPTVTATIPLALAVDSVTAIEHTATAAVPLVLAVEPAAQTVHSAAADVPLGLVIDPASQATHQATADVPLSIAVNPVTSAPGVGPAQATATIPLTIAVAPATRTDHTAAAVVGLGLVVDAAAQATHQAVAAVPLGLVVDPASQIGHAVAADVPLGLVVNPVTDAPPDAGTVAATIPLALAVGADVATQYQASAAIPLALSVDPAAATSHVAAATVPLALNAAPAAQVQHQAAAQVSLLLVLDPRTIDPELVSVPVSFVVGRHPGPAGAAGRHPSPAGAVGRHEDVAAPGLYEITISIEGASP